MDRYARDGCGGGDMLPEAFLERMGDMLGEEYGAFLEAMEGERHQGLCLNPRKRHIEGQSAAERFGMGSDEEKRGIGEWQSVAMGSREAEGRDAGFAHLTRVPWASEGYYYERQDQPGRHPFHEAGVYYIQEPSAMAPVELLDVRPGERVLDLCAAPGGKSVQIAAKLCGSGFLLCNEINPGRARILSENIERMGICNACVTNEAPERLAELLPGSFDRILVDAPCSGEGMFRKNEAACGEWSPENVALCASRQDGILECAAKLLRPGGKLVYSTCTFAPEENEGSVSRFLKRHREFTLLPVEKERMGLAGCDGMPECLEDAAPGLECALRLWPQRIRGEGHFAALLGKAGEIWEETRENDIKITVKRDCMELWRGFSQFCEENLCLGEAVPGKAVEMPPKRGLGGERGKKADMRTEARRQDVDVTEELAGLGEALGLKGSFRSVAFGANLYLLPADMPLLSGLKVLRPGLHLGELKKNRFEPSHALALALGPRYARRVWKLGADAAGTAAYLNGQTFPGQGEKGWYLICVDGFGLGWGKLAAGIMKNHYPRGLRR